MAIDFNKKFNELFGGEEAQASAPTLRDVAPGLINADGSRFQSKELNPRRTAVSARNFRNPRVRSKEGAFERGGAVEKEAPAFAGSGGPDYSGTGRADVESGGRPGVGGAGGDVGPAGDALGSAIGTSLAGSIGGNIGFNALSGGAAALGMGASAGQAANLGLSSAMGGLLSPIGLAGLANTVGGGLVAGQIAQGTTEGTSTLSQEAQANAFQAANSGFGLLGMGVKGVGSLLGLNESPIEAAQNAASFSKGMGFGAEESTGGGIDAGPGPSGFGIDSTIGVGGNQNMINTGQVLGMTSDNVASPSAALGMTGVTGQAAPTATVQGLVQRGGVAGQEGPTGGNTGIGQGQTGQDPTGRGGGVAGAVGVGGTVGGGGSSGGTTGISGEAGGIGAGAGVGTVICTELNRQGLMSDEMLKKEVEFSKDIPEVVLEGYRVWGKVLAKAMRKSKIVTWFIKFPAMAWAKHMAGEPNLFGKVAMAVGVPICKVIGNLKRS